MKSHTDLEQSKKLAEFLSPESADMCWTNHRYGRMRGSMTISAISIHEYKKLLESFADSTSLDVFYPCWSLAALFDMLPKFIGDYGKCLYYDVDGYHCGYMDDGNFMLTIQETKADNSVDACCEMIINLHKLSLL